MLPNHSPFVQETGPLRQMARMLVRPPLYSASPAIGLMSSAVTTLRRIDNPYAMSGLQEPKDSPVPQQRQVGTQLQPQHLFHQACHVPTVACNELRLKPQRLCLCGFVSILLDLPTLRGISFESYLLVSSCEPGLYEMLMSFTRLL